MSRRLHLPRRLAAPASAALALVLLGGTASANVTLTTISSDPYTNSTSQHAAQVEPDSFSSGSTIVAATQTGRYTDGGASNICWATSTNSGASWVNGCLPGITIHASVPGTATRVSDPAVAYDARHNTWLISSLPLDANVNAMGVYTSRSTDGGLTWGNPILVTDSQLGSVDKNWIVCDNTATSPWYGNCYTEWDDNGNGNRLYMSVSSDGGLTWSSRRATANNGTGLGGQPVVQPNGTVIVPSANANETSIISYRSTNGGATWSATATVSAVSAHRVAGNLRSGPLPSAEIDAAGKVYVVWQDCRFRRGCTANDIVMSTTTDGVTWSAVTRVPIDAVTSKVDHFIPGLAVDNSSSGSTARLALAYYYYSNTKCNASTCQLNVGFISSQNGGTSWSAATQLAGPMSLAWLPSTTQGVMVGDYISTSFSGGTAHPVFIVAQAKSGTTFNQAMVTPAAGLSVAVAAATMSGLDQAVFSSNGNSAPASILHRQ